MDLTRTKLYQAIKEPGTSSSELWKMCEDYITSKKKINITDQNTGESFMHVLSGHGGQLVSTWGVSVVYLVASSGIHLDTRDKLGETCLHKAARVAHSFRVVEALMRCGVDPLVKNNDGKSAADVLQSDKPNGWEHTLHWFNKYSPGLYHASSAEVPDIRFIERLLKGWCRTRICRSDGEDVGLTSVVTMQDTVRNLLRKYGPTNEFVIAMLSGKPPDLHAVTFADINIETKDHMNEGEGHKPPEVPMPLLMATWEARNEHCIDTLLEYGANTSTLFSRTGTRTEAEPLFFHLLTNDNRPPNSIIHKILRVSNMNVRNQSGQTVLFKAILNDFSSQFIKALFKYGVNLAARDRKGRTARDYSESLRKTKHFTEIDEQIMEIVRDCDLDSLQRLVLEGYDHIVDVTDNKGINIIHMLKQFYTLNPNKEEVVIFMEKILAVQRHLGLMFRATDTGGTDELRRLSSRKFAGALDKCGRTILHKAILNKKKDMIKFIVQNYKHIIDLQDNVGRCALHYAYLVTEGTSLVNYLLLHGANPHISDWAGRTPDAYHIESCGKEEYVRLQVALNSFTMDVYLAETNFEQSLLAAIRHDDSEGVEELVLGLTDKGDINRYANILFHCVDSGRQRIAVYLIQQGMRTDIYKQYETCNARSSACSTYTCDHMLTSLYTRAKDLKCNDIVKAITVMSDGNGTEVDGRPTIKGPSTMDQFSLLGMV